MRSRVFFLFAIAGSATSARIPHQAVPVRTVAPVVATTKAPLQAISSGVRELPGGKVLINDATAYQLLLFDSTLTLIAAVRDSVSGPMNYGRLTSNVIPYLGDSSLFVDNASQSMLVIDPSGRVTRPMAMPTARDINPLRRGVGPATDPRGRLVYKAALPVALESLSVIRADFNARSIDSVARYKITGARRVMVRGESRTMQDPMPMIDEWTMVSDGTIAIVRGYDYHIDWIDLDGKVTSTAKMSFDWRRLTDADKERVHNAAKDEARRSDSAFAAMTARPSQPATPQRERLFYPVNEISDYYPPMREGAVRADRDNNVWILPTTTVQSRAGELVYDVVNRKGELFERVRLPAGRSIAGFGRNGAIYMMWRDVAKGWFIERTHIVR